METNIHKDLPSLNALRIFESAARHGNFTRASAELFVTQGAVSRQIKQLEQELGCDLFLRQGPKVQLTQDGEQFYRVVEEALTLIRRGASRIRRHGVEEKLTVSLLPSYAHNWLIPRLPSLEKACPSIKLNLSLSYESIDFSQDPSIDAAVRLGRGVWPHLFAYKLSDHLLTPVCSPAVAETLKQPEDLKNHRLVVEPEGFDEWARWLKVARVDASQSKKLHLDDFNLQILAAVEGQGVSLCREAFVANEIASGRLVKPFDIQVLAHFQYYFVCPPSHMKDQKVDSFFHWIKDENA